MKKLAGIAMIPLFAGFLFAQDQRTDSSTTTTTTTWNGTLVDAGCRSSHSERHESTTTTPTSQSTSKSERHEVSDCPVTTSTTSFGLMTSDGKYIRFDDPSNTKIVETVKSNNDWNRSVSSNQPIRVRVVGRPNGDVVVVESIH